MSGARRLITCWGEFGAGTAQNNRFPSKPSCQPVLRLCPAEPQLPTSPPRVQSEAARAAYRSDFAPFRAWCARRGISALPASPETVAGGSGTALPW
jgi:hypothetical protein